LDHLLIVGTLDGGTVQGIPPEKEAELCNAIRRQQGGSCPGMRLPEAAPRKGLASPIASIG